MNKRPQSSSASSLWSNRILILAMIGIFSLTLYPFRFNFTARLPGQTSPFLLGPSTKYNDYNDFFLNILLFVPFGFGLAAQLRKRGASRMRRFAIALIGGMFVSYLVEFLQIYVPMRSSGWDDVCSNSTGSVFGFFLFELCGDTVLRTLSRCENAVEDWFSPRQTAWLLLIYFGVCFGISIPLQEETRLTDWNAQLPLSIGNDSSGQNAWKGRVFRLQIWNRALPEKLIRQLAARNSTGDTSPDDDQTALLASYDFTSPPPYLDQTKFLPALSWMSGAPSPDDTKGLELNGTSWLSSGIPVTNLTREIQKTNQFSVRIVCAPQGVRKAYGHIVSISGSAEDVNLRLRQEIANLVLWFRNPISEDRSVFAWTIPGVFEAGRVRDIVATYDGSDAFIYVDGKKMTESYDLGPGAGLKHKIVHRVDTRNLDAYIIVYETLIFLPAGMLIGISGRKWFNEKVSGRLLLVLYLFLPPVLLEMLLMWVSGRGLHAPNILFSLFLAIAGAVLINADGMRWSSNET